MIWPSLPLEDTCSLITDGTHYSPPDAGEGVPFLTVKDMTGDGLAFKTASRMTRMEFDKALASNCAPRPGDVLFSKDGTVGKVHVVTERNDFAVLSSIAILRPKPLILDSAFLGHVLRSPAVLQKAANSKTGSALTRIVLKDLKRVRIPLPPLAEQRRIAAVLDKADAIRRKRRESLGLLDEFLRSAFLEMFGDPVRNEKGWDREQLQDIAVVSTGNTPSRSHAEFYGDDIEWIKSDNINTPSAYVTRAREGLSSAGRELGRTVGPGAILMTCIAGTRDCIGNVAITDREVAFNQQINAVEPEPEIDHRFLYAQLLLGKPLVQRASTDSMKGMVSKSRLERLQVMAPPRHLQQRFGKWFSRWHEVRSQQRVAEDAAGLLFDSLAQRAFRGELWSGSPAADA